MNDQEMDLAPGDLPGPMKQLHEQFMELPGRVLQERFSELEKIFSTITGDYDELLAPLRNDIEKEVTSGDHILKELMISVQSFLDRVNRFVTKHGELHVEEFFRKIINETEEKYAEISAASVPYSHDLDLSFWKEAPVGGFFEKSLKKYHASRLRLKAFLHPKQKKQQGFYGKQEYNPGELFHFYYVIPVAGKMLELLEKYFQGYAEKYHELHNSSEALVKRIVQAEADLVSDPGILFTEIRTMIDTIQYESKGTGESRDNLLEELKEFQAEQIEILEEEALIAGTLLHPAGMFSRQIAEQRVTTLTNKYKERSVEWKAYFKAEKDDWLKDIQVMNLAHNALEICWNTRGQLLSRTEKNILPSIRDAADMVSESASRFQDRKGADEASLKESILNESRSTFRSLRKERIPHIIDQLNQSDLSRVLNNAHSLVKYKVSELNDNYRILRSLDLDDIPPGIRSQNISLKKIIETEYLSDFSEKFRQLSRQAESTLELRLRTLNEISQVIEFNIESALELLDARDESPAGADAGKVVSEGLERAYDILESTRAEFEKAPVEWWEQLKEMLLGLNGKITELSDNEKILILQIREARAAAASRYRTYRGALAKQFNNYFKRAWSWISYGITGARTGYMQISRITGQITLPEKEREFMDSLYSTRKKINALPYVYQRLYRFEPLVDTVLFGGREGDIESIREKYEQWKSGSFANTMVTGEKGSGRTTLMNLASLKIGKSLPVFRIRISKKIDEPAELLQLLAQVATKEQVASFGELHKTLNAMERPVICFVEDLHFLFLRTLDGFDLVEKFLWLISQTHQKVYWIVSMGSFSWTFLDKVLSISRYFHHVISLSQLEASQMREIIMKRHRMSGYRLEFIPSEADLNDRKFKKLKNEKERQEYLDANFFRELHSITKGNISVAFLLWQLSVEEFRKDKVLIKKQLKQDTAFLNDLPEEELFTLEAVLEHEVLTAEEHSVIFAEEEEQSTMILNRMKNKGLLVETGTGFQIHYMIYKPVIKTLNSKNILK